MPVHAHFVGRGSAVQGDTPFPQSAVWAQSAAGRGTAALYADSGNAKVNQLQSLFPTGGSLPHNNMQPYLTLSFCIALQGVFPARQWGLFFFGPPPPAPPPTFIRCRPLLQKEPV
jgi:microcystin-dependent protein